MAVYPQYPKFSGSNFTLKLYIAPKTVLARLTLYEYMNIRDATLFFAS